MKVPTRVGSRPEGISPYGALDMSGNVWEWVEDRCHQDYPGAPRGAAFRPDSQPECYGARGGGMGSDEPRKMRASNRDGAARTEPSDHHGLRCALSPPS